jgi:hypothetical protein
VRVQMDLKFRGYSKVRETTTRDVPILFSAPMVRAILAGQKRQTRRLLRFPAWTLGTDGQPTPTVLHNLMHAGGVAFFADGQPRFRMTLRWREGDRLWVKETSYIAPVGFGDRDLCNATDTEGQRRMVGYVAHMDADSERCARDYGVKKLPAIFMPRWASRLTLEVTGVRVERLQDITAEDAVAEGIMNQAPVVEFHELWDLINAKRATWDSNPWVCVVSFARLAAPRAPGEEG